MKNDYIDRGLNLKYILPNLFPEAEILVDALYGRRFHVISVISVQHDSGEDHMALLDANIHLNKWVGLRTSSNLQRPEYGHG